MGLLDASGNEISAVAPELGQCTSLRRLVLDGNPLRAIRQNLLTGRGLHSSTSQLNLSLF